MERTPWKLPHGIYIMEVTYWNIHHRRYFMERTQLKLPHGTYIMGVT